ncbi:MAG: ABC transporter ATP-binding protein [Defluviitaleaceae bacterium]|nr:ABC transporter ATP-binding protein [Defluviitaleaceae bacterium]
MLKIDQMSYRYKNSDRDVLKKIDVEFKAGDMSVILGPSGSGKTTMLSIMAGLDRPTQGNIFVGKKSLADMDLDLYRREEISMVFQAFQLFPLLTAIENVCYPMESNGVKRKDAEEKARGFLNSVGITNDKHKRYPANLSGGEQQRVAIARALSSGARVILADEPTGNLDVANGDIVINILKHLAHQEDYCVIIVTHNLEIAEKADVIYRMSDGVLKKQE